MNEGPSHRNGLICISFYSRQKAETMYMKDLGLSHADLSTAE